MTKPEILALLRAENPKARDAELVIYADAFLEYQAAQQNITENGAVVFHPRTGAPIENPFVKTRNQASAVLRKIRLRTGDLWSLEP